MKDQHQTNKLNQNVTFWVTFIRAQTKFSFAWYNYQKCFTVFSKLQSYSLVSLVSCTLSPFQKYNFNPWRTQWSSWNNGNLRPVFNSTTTVQLRLFPKKMGSMCCYRHESTKVHMQVRQWMHHIPSSVNMMQYYHTVALLQVGWGWNLWRASTFALASFHVLVLPFFFLTLSSVTLVYTAAPFHVFFLLPLPI